MLNDKLDAVPRDTPIMVTKQQKPTNHNHTTVGIVQQRHVRTIWYHHMLSCGPHLVPNTFLNLFWLLSFFSYFLPSFLLYFLPSFPELLHRRDPLREGKRVSSCWRLSGPSKSVLVLLFVGVWFIGG